MANTLVTAEGETMERVSEDLPQAVTDAIDRLIDACWEAASTHFEREALVTAIIDAIDAAVDAATDGDGNLYLGKDQ